MVTRVRHDLLEVLLLTEYSAGSLEEPQPYLLLSQYSHVNLYISDTVTCAYTFTMYMLFNIPVNCYSLYMHIHAYIFTCNSHVHIQCTVK